MLKRALLSVTLFSALPFAIGWLLRDPQPYRLLAALAVFTVPFWAVGFVALTCALADALDREWGA